MNRTSLALRLFAPTFAVFAVACGSAQEAAEATLTDQEGAGFHLPPDDALGDQQRGIHCNDAHIPGVDDPSEYLKMCGGGGGGVPRPTPPPVAAPACSSADRALPAPDHRTAVVDCTWNHSGVGSKDATWLETRQRAKCIEQWKTKLNEALRAAGQGGPEEVVCGDVASFSIGGTDTDRSWDGKRSFKAWGTSAFSAVIRGPYAILCNREPTHWLCNAESLSKVDASFGD